MLLSEIKGYFAINLTSTVKLQLQFFRVVNSLFVFLCVNRSFSKERPEQIALIALWFWALKGEVKRTNLKFSLQHPLFALLLF